MYCVNCGVKLADTETACPLCQTTVYHPDIKREQGIPNYPIDVFPTQGKRSLALPIVMTAVIVLAAAVSLLSDWQLGHVVTWSGYVIGALFVAYTACVLPVWFRSPNPVVFVPCTFAAVIVYLWYIDLVTGDEWFWTFALPVTAAIGILVTAVVVLMRYVPKGALYIIGGALILFGVGMFPMEWLLTLTFDAIPFIGWSFYPLVTFVLMGGTLIFLAVCRPARETMERKFFI